MLVHTAKPFLIYFGDAYQGISLEEYTDAYHLKGAYIPERCELLRKFFSLEKSVFLRQTHSIDGFIIFEKPYSELRPFLYEGDFLITNKAGIGIGVLTADCLPIIFYDPVHNVIAVAHAGLQGSIAGIAPKVVEIMKKQFGSSPNQLQIFFGPAARWCCYTINKDLAQQLKDDYHRNFESFLRLKNNCYMLDLARFNRYLLEEYHVEPNAFCFDYNCCTICNSSFCSYRRQKEKANRQITTAVLRKEKKELVRV